MSNKTVLIVEDNILHMKLFNDILELQGYKTLQATDGEIVLEMTRENNPDLILLDVRLPNKSGFEVARQLKNEQDLKDIPVVAVTALGNTLERNEYLSWGFDGFLSKPIAIQNLLRTVADCLMPTLYQKTA